MDALSIGIENGSFLFSIHLLFSNKYSKIQEVPSDCGDFGLVHSHSLSKGLKFCSIWSYEVCNI